MLISIGIDGVEIQDTQDMKKFLIENKNNWDYIDEALINNVEENCYIVFYLQDEIESEKQILSVKQGLNRLKSISTQIDFGSLALEQTNTNDEEWVNKWKEHYKPFEVGNKIVIKPFWEQYVNSKKIVFDINPGHVFGTGLHITTQMCIIRLEKYVNKNIEVLDLGCGSGILSIISLLLGAKSALAVDIDENAVNIAYENAGLNNIDKSIYTVVSGDILQDIKVKNLVCAKKYDIVVANIVADVIISFSGFVTNCIKQDGVFIACGIIKDRLQEVYEKLEQKGFIVVDTFFEQEWVCIVSKLKP
jgi:ribosomal protein L11 methyltransferase